MLVKLNDNSGCTKVITINYKSVQNKFGYSLSSLKNCKPGKLKSGQLHLASINGRRQWCIRKTGINSKLSHNLGSLIKKDHTPYATRLYRSVYLESRIFGFMRLAVLSKNLI